jgi:hypothetical protein
MPAITHILTSYIEKMANWRYLQRPRITLLFTVLYQKGWPWGKMAKIVICEHINFASSAVICSTTVAFLSSSSPQVFLFALLYKMFSATASLLLIKGYKYLCFKSQSKKQKMKPEIKLVCKKCPIWVLHFAKKAFLKLKNHAYYLIATV